MTMKNLLVFGLSLLGVGMLSAQQTHHYQQVKLQISGVIGSFDERVAASGNHYLFGFRPDTVVINGDSIIPNTTGFFQHPNSVIIKTDSQYKVNWHVETNAFFQHTQTYNGQDEYVYMCGGYRSQGGLDLMLADTTVDLPPQNIPYTLMARLDSSGSVDWLRVFPHVLFNGNYRRVNFLRTVVDSLGAMYVMGIREAVDYTFDNVTLTAQPNQQHVFLLKVSPSGQVVWGRDIAWGDPQLGSTNPVALDLDAQGNLYVWINADEPLSSQNSQLQPQIDQKNQLLLKLDPNGNEVWSKSFKAQFDYSQMKAVPDGLILYLEFEASTTIADTTLQVLGCPGDWALALVKLDFQGQRQWARMIDNGCEKGLGDLAVSTQGEVFITGRMDGSLVDFGDNLLQAVDMVQTNYPFWAKFSAEGTTLWANTVAWRGFSGTEPRIESGPDGRLKAILDFAGDSLLLDGTWLTAQLERDFVLLDISDSTYVPPGFSNLAQGRVYLDTDSNCVFAAPDAGQHNWLVQRQPGAVYTLSSDSGFYSFPLDTGSYELRAFPMGWAANLVQPVCPIMPDFHAVSFAGANQDSLGLDFAYQGAACALPTVTLSSFSEKKRVCQRNFNLIQYRNEGLDTAFNSLITFRTAPYNYLAAADHPWTWNPIDSVYEFAVGDLAPGFSGSIRVYDSIACDPLVLLAHPPGTAILSEVQISPEQNCFTPDPAWDQSDLVVDGYCSAGGIVYFTIKNIGVGDMGDSTQLRLFRNDLLVHTAKVKLQAGDSLSFQVVGAGNMYRCQVFQHPLHPQRDWVADFVEGCGSAQGFVPKWGYVIQYPTHDPEPQYDARITELSASFDPNDKQAIPAGRGPQHGVEPGTRLRYTIRFQNTGNDTAFQVILRDTLDPGLDPMSFQIIGASHPYSIQLSGSESIKLAISFPGIALPDSNVNVLGSQGFFSFSLRPKDSLPLGTEIRNRASIYFDFNAPVITNEVFHTLLLMESDSAGDLQLETCDASPDLPKAGADLLFCGPGPDTVVVQALPVNVGFGFWEIATGQAQLSAFDSATAYLTQLDTGLTVLRWQVAYCGSLTFDELTIVRSDPQVMPVIAGDSAFCAGDSVLLSAQGPYSFFVWNTGDSTQQIWVRDSLSLQVFGVDQWGCEGPNSLFRDIAEIPIPAPPVIQVMGDSLLVNIAADRYQWRRDSTVLAHQGQILLADSTGNYQVRVEIDGCLSEWSDPILVNSVGITGSLQNRYRIYPNPTSGALTVEGPAPGRPVKVEVRDLRSRLLWKFEAIMPIGGLHLLLELPALPSGHYMIRINDGYQGLIELRP